MWVTRALFAVVAVVVSATAAAADITLFIGSTTSPANRPARGFAVGAGLLVIGFEFEYSSSSEDAEAGAPSLRTGMGNVLLQTPGPIAGIQPYFTTGAGGYREQLGAGSTTHVGVNTGGGAKISLVGPLRARIDYRVFRLNGSPLANVVHRLYAGANLSF
jgi:hypothetical protein